MAPRRMPVLRGTGRSPSGPRASRAGRSATAMDAIPAGVAAVDDLAVVREALGGVVEHAAERPARVEIEPWHADLADAQAQLRRLHPDLQRHAPPLFGDA